MRLVLSTAPAAEPLTAAEVKLHAKIDTSADDTLIESLITAARRLFEEQTGRSLVNTTWTGYLDRWPRLGTWVGAGLTREIELPRAPLVSVESVKYLDTAGSEQTLAGSSYTVEAGLDANRFGRLWLKADAAAPDLGDFPGALRVRFVAGYGASASAVPAEIKAALRLLVTHLYENRTPVNIGNIVNELPYTLQHLIELHQIRTLV